MTEQLGTASHLLTGSRIAVCDGAMGTMLHAAGIDLTNSLCELNVSRPRLVLDVHRAYVAAGAQILQTNTFDGNRLRLGRAGQAERVSEINIAGARLTRKAAQSATEPTLVAGSIGPVLGSTLAPRISPSQRSSALREQVAALADWVDVILLETFGDIETLALAVTLAQAECDLPIIAQLTFGDDGLTLRGETPQDAAAEIGKLDVAALGANCTVGPAVLHEVVAALASSCSLPVSVQPNAGLPRRRGKHLHYAHNVEYFAEAARQFVSDGATIVGGCCGTTPAHIRAVARSVRGLVPAPRTRAQVTELRPARTATREAGRPTPDPTWPRAGFSVVVATRPPRDVDVAQFVVRAEDVLAAGVDALAVFDPNPPTARVSAVAAGMLLQERLGVRMILQVDASDRSPAALQADLLGAHALRLNIVVCRTGAPRAFGDYPEPASSWGIDSLGLVSLVGGLNDGVDWRGVPMSSRTTFSIGASVSPAAQDRDRELARVEAKVAAGAGFLVTDAVFDADPTLEFLAALRARGVSTPVLATLTPFDDPAAILAMTNETPGGVPIVASAGVDPVERPFDIVSALGDAVAGVVLHAPTRDDPRWSELLARFSELRRSG